MVHGDIFFIPWGWTSLPWSGGPAAAGQLAPGPEGGQSAGDPAVAQGCQYHRTLGRLPSGQQQPHSLVSLACSRLHAV
jgi:hypothetical protein